MNEAEIRAHLESLKEQVTERLQRTHKHIHNKDEAVSADFHEQVKQTENDQLVYALDAEGKQELLQINHALQRLDEGEYGICSSCGQQINPDRLKAIPFTEHCIDCA